MIFITRDSKLDSGELEKGGLSAIRRSASRLSPIGEASLSAAPGSLAERLLGERPHFFELFRVEFWVSDNKKHQGWASKTSYRSISDISGAAVAIPWPLESAR